MNRKLISLILMVGLALLVPACSLSPTATPTPVDVTPEATSTDLPPRPSVPYTPVPADTLSPSVIQRAPLRGETLAPDGAIELVFDREMDQQTAAGAFKVLAAGKDTPLKGAVSWTDKRTLRFQPAESLDRAAAYDVVLTQDATANTGEPLREPYTFRFSTAGFLEVAQVIPEPGTTDLEVDSNITVIFNRPVVPLTSLGQMADFPDPLEFEPAIAGQGEWLNTSIYVFTPDAPFAGGVTYQATVTSGLQDISGALLAEDYVWEFSIAPPEIVWGQPYEDSTLVDIYTPVILEFNQPVTPESVQRAFSLKSAGLFSGDINGNFQIQGNTVTFTPTQALSFDTQYTVNVEAGVQSVSGGEGMRESVTWSFRTVPLPEIVSTEPSNGQRNVPAYTDFRIVFNAPIDPETVMPNISMTPPFSSTQVYTYFSTYDNTFVLGFGVQPSTDYTVVIGDGIADPYGNTIPRGRTVKFTTGPLDPNYWLQVPDMVGTYDAAQPAQVVLGYLNINRVNLRLYKMSKTALFSSYWDWEENLADDGELLRDWSLPLESPLNQRSYMAIQLSESADGKLDPGVYFLDVEAPQLDSERYYYNAQHVLVVSDFNVTLKISPDEAVVWATDLTGGDPVPDLELTFMGIYGGPLGKATTGADGVARLELSQDRNTVLAYSENPFVAISEDWGRGISPWDFGMGEGVYEQDYRTYIYTDRSIYRPGQTVNFKGVIRAEDDAAFNLPGMRDVDVMIRNAAYEEVFNETLPVSDLGTFDGSLVLEDGAPLGQYVIVVMIHDHYVEEYFTVAAYRAPEFEVTVDVAPPEVQRGDDIEATLNAAYYFGGPLADTEVSWNILEESYRFTPSWGGSYSFSDVDDPYTCFDCWWWYQEPSASEPLLSGSGTTDANGELQINIDGAELKELLTKHGSRLIIEATATGPDNQRIAGRSGVIVHPGPYYFGLRAQDYVGDAGKENAIDLVAADWSGERLADREIEVAFYHYEWINVFRENQFGGGYWDWDTEETLVETVRVTTDSLGEAVAAFVPEEGGSYHVVATPANPDSQTEKIRSSIFIWVAGEDNVSWRRENNDRINLISDKSSYHVGETAEILIPAPFDGPYTAWVTVERGGVRRHEVLRLESNSAVYQLPITGEDIPNIYVSVVLVKGRGDDAYADFKMGLLPLEVELAPKELTLEVESGVEQAEPGESVTYTVTAKLPNGEPAAGTELSLDVVDKAVLALQPRSNNILSYFYARRALQVRTASGLSVAVNRYLEELREDLDESLQYDTGSQMANDEVLEEKAALDFAADGEMPAAPAPGAGPVVVTQEVQGETVEVVVTATAERAWAGGSHSALPQGVDIRTEFADTAFWQPYAVTDGRGQVAFTVAMPDNLTTWVVRGVGLDAQTQVGEGTTDLVTAKPLMVRPVAPRFFVVEDRAQLGANITNNTNQDLEVEVGLSSDGVYIEASTPPLQTVTIPAHSETQVNWWVVVNDVEETQLIFSAVAEDPTPGSERTYSDASKPRLTTGEDGSLLVFRYTTPDIVGTAGQLIEEGSRTEAVGLPPNFDERRGQLTVELDPSLAAGMQDGLEYLEHYEYECTEQTVSRFLPNVLTYDALQSLGIDDPELAEKLPDLVQEGLEKLYKQQNPDGGWGWWYDADDARSNVHVSAYVVFALVKTQQADIAVSQDVLQRGVSYLERQLISKKDIQNFRDANRQAWLLYVLTEAGSNQEQALDTLFENREKLSYYARAYLAQALWLEDEGDARLNTLLSDFNNDAILSATGAHWEESAYGWWSMNTDTRSTAIILDTLVKLDPDNALLPNVVRWLMVARETGIWETTQETAWALIALTDWMVETGELDADYVYGLYLNDVEQGTGEATRESIRESLKVEVPVSELDPDDLNTLTIARSDGPGRLYYTAHLEVYQPVDEVEPADRGIIVSRRYTLADCEGDRAACPEAREIKLGDVVRVDLTIIVPHDRYYVVVEDPLPAGGEAIDTGLATTSLLAMDPTLRRENSRYWWWWHWYSRSELRDEKVVLFAEYLSKGTYEYSYTFRATLPGDYHVMPTVAQEFYFPEVFGRSDGRLLTIVE